MNIKKTLEDAKIQLLAGEEFKKIEGYDYLISNYGRVISLNFRRMKIVAEIKPNKNTKGYWKVGLWKKGEKQKVMLIHRLVAEHFLEKIEGLYTVGFKDGDINNFKLENLYWK